MDSRLRGDERERAREVCVIPAQAGIQAHTKKLLYVLKSSQVEKEIVRVIKQMIFRGLLEEAIMQEEAAYTFYQDALHVVSEPQVVTLLKTLMAGELQHKLKLEELQQQREFARQAVSDVIQDGLSWRQDEHQEGSSLRLLPGMSCREILSIALLKEQQAARQYSRLSERARFPLVQNLFRVLSHEEVQHVAWIQQQLTSYSPETSTQTAFEVLP